MSKGLEAIISLRNRLVEKGIKDQFLEELIVIEKELKALEIILKGCANIRIGKYETEDRYYITINYLSSDITKEEHDLLKEV